MFAGNTTASRGPTHRVPWLTLSPLFCRARTQVRAGDEDLLSPPLPAWFGNRGFTFQSAAWRHGDITCVPLTQIFRQQDVGMITHLNALREARDRPSVDLAARFFRHRCSAPLPITGQPPIKPTKLYPRVARVRGVNESELRRLAGAVVEYEGHDFVTADMEQVIKELGKRGITRPPPRTSPHGTDEVPPSLFAERYGVFAATMLNKMGHVEGQGLGPDGAGIRQPVTVSPRGLSRAGLGFASSDRDPECRGGLGFGVGAAADEATPGRQSDPHAYSQFTPPPAPPAPPPPPTPEELAWQAALEDEATKFETVLWRNFQGFRVPGPRYPVDTPTPRPLREPRLQLKVGAQVILLQNLDLLEEGTQMLVNGSRGVVITFLCAQATLAWLAEMSQRKDITAQARGVYTEEHATLAEFLRREHNAKKIPVVRFQNGRVVRVMPGRFSSEINGLGVCHRLQIPLQLAWALTIHKAQGMSLDLVEMELEQCFCPGQIYVALSRARSLRGLRIVGRADWVRHATSDPLVRQFYADMRGDDGSGAFMAVDRGDWAAIPQQIRAL